MKGRHPRTMKMVNRSRLGLGGPYRLASKGKGKNLRRLT